MINSGSSFLLTYLISVLSQLYQNSSKILSVLYELFWFQLWIYVVRTQKMAPIDYN